MDRYKVSLKDEFILDKIQWMINNIPNENWDTTFVENGPDAITYYFSNKDDLTKFSLTWL